MDYPFENLGPEKFQLFCQALIVRENPGVLCLPVAQPDGGRDAFQQSFFRRSKDQKATAFQVKFNRAPNSVEDVFTWATEIADAEIEKVERLKKEAGVGHYYLLTNVQGSSHFKTGSIDRVQEELTRRFGIPTTCYWRNDLARRLDDAWNLKWAYPELMTGPDLIRAIFESSVSPLASEQTTTIRTFVAAQYRADLQVKFKQVDILNNLLDLFIDVPIHLTPSVRATIQVEVEHFRPKGEWVTIGTTAVRWDRQFVHAHDEHKLGTAAFLLTRAPHIRNRAIVLEGAPGQGKSTITQYICQVHRMRILGMPTDLIPDSHMAGGIYLPFKVDLRDFAIWLARKNPFTADTTDTPPPNWEKSLESFLAALVTDQSGGALFSVKDFHAVLKRSSTIIVLDGLDEVADIKRREDVVSEILKALDRLRSIAADLMLLVTSRPAAFANAPGLPASTFQFISLTDVTIPLIQEYAEKWLKCRGASQQEAIDVKRVLNNKVGQPHIRDLARNPMQLAILLSLIYSRGASLPDKRTALYDKYVELFFSREAEKTSLVRDHHDLLRDIHYFLGFLLHLESEQANGSQRRGSGSIEEGRLREVLSRYLKDEQRDDKLVEVLFSGVVERVVALVSRVQGTYEFEVQPLREYFAARFLYETAPYSPPGEEKRGTMPDRFDALARNFHWLNVVRFYAGCYSKGELESLIRSLRELKNDPPFARLCHPRVLAATLLSDWVFSQDPKSVSEVVRLTLEDLDFRLLLVSSESGRRKSETISLPEQCGRRLLVDRCFAILSAGVPLDFAFEIVDLVCANGNPEELRERWSGADKKPEGSGALSWLRYALRLKIISDLSAETLLVLVRAIDPMGDAVGVVLDGNRSDIFESDEALFQQAANAVLEMKILRTSDDNPPTLREGRRTLTRLGSMLDPVRFAASFGAKDDLRIDALWATMKPHQDALREIEPKTTLELESKKNVEDIVKRLESLGQIECGKWRTSIGPWSLLIDAVGADHRIAGLFAIMGASGAASEVCDDAEDFFDQSKPLARRMRFAALRTGAAQWWRHVLGAASEHRDKERLVTMWLFWAERSTLLSTMPAVESILASMAEDAWTQLLDFIDVAKRFIHPLSRPKLFRQPSKLLGGASLRMRVLITRRLDSGDARTIVENVLDTYTGDERSVLSEIAPAALRRAVAYRGDWQRSLEICRLLYKSDYLFGEISLYEVSRTMEMRMRGPAETVLNDPTSYPSILIGAAERVMRSSTAKQIRPLVGVANEQEWLPVATTS